MIAYKRSSTLWGHPPALGCVPASPPLGCSCEVLDFFMGGLMALANYVGAIETTFNDYRFRSRLEARWAVCFECMGWPYQYEPEGYSLGRAGYYLPDFWIPINPEQVSLEYEGAGYWVEIKGKPLSKEEKLKIAALAYYTKHTVKVFIGTSGDHYEMVCHHKGVKHFAKQQQARFGRDLGLGMPFGLISFDCQLGYETESDIEAAISKAKQARFEHGETPEV